MQIYFKMMLVAFVTTFLLILIYHRALIKSKYKKFKLPMKTILYWTPILEFGLGRDIFKTCPYTNCYTTNNKTMLPIDKYDAVIFHGNHGVPENRSSNQVYIFVSLESPSYTPSLKNFNGFYNWTMTYRRDSDVVLPHGVIREALSTGYTSPKVEDVKKRTGRIIWCLTNRNTSSGREKLTEKIQKKIPVDIYDTNTCSNYTMLENIYKFSLAFEDSVCEDYITEMFHVLKRNIVPIVYGGADYSIFAPSKSVINVMDFNSVDELVQYLKYLDAFPEEYLKYFVWKRGYQVDTSRTDAACTLCEKLNKNLEMKVYEDMDVWWKGNQYDFCFDGILKADSLLD